MAESSSTVAKSTSSEDAPAKGARLQELYGIMEALLAPDGCPWDKEQTFGSLRPYVVEEAFEVVEAVDGLLAQEDDAQGRESAFRALKEELGDLLFQVVFLSALAERAQAFDLDDVVGAIGDKMVRRHPWVFGDEKGDDAGEGDAFGADAALGRWEAMKAKERKEGKKKAKPKGLLSGVPRALPALLRALRVGEKAAAVGYDWPDAAGPRAKVDEELGELDEALGRGDAEAAEEELGDALFAMVNFARKHALDPEAALRRSLDKFSRRLGHAENAAGGDLASKSAAELDALWEQAKAAERVTR